MRNGLCIFVHNNSIGDTVYFVSGGAYDTVYFVSGDTTISAAEFYLLIKMVIARSPSINVCFPLTSGTNMWYDFFSFFVHMTVLSSNGVSIH